MSIGGFTTDQFALYCFQLKGSQVEFGLVSIQTKRGQTSGGNFCLMIFNDGPLAIWGIKGVESFPFLKVGLFGFESGKIHLTGILMEQARQQMLMIR